jgi:hypothetical protein
MMRGASRLATMFTISRKALPAICVALSGIGISPHAKAASDGPVAYVLDMWQTQDGAARHFLLRCTDYRERSCQGRITLSLDGHLQDIDVAAAIGAREAFVKLRTAEGYLRAGSRSFIRLAVEGVPTLHDVDLYEALPEIERLKPYPVERFAKRAATIQIEIRPVR